MPVDPNHAGTNHHPIVVTDYDPRWPEMFDRLRDEVRAAVGDAIPEIHHAGSTAVPGLAAKPIIDLLGGVQRLSDADAACEALQSLGYIYMPQYEDEMPYRRYFTRVNAVHFHVVEIGHDFYVRHLAFRDWLRDHDHERDAYAALKRELAETYRHDRTGYTDAKSEFIRAIEAQALRP